MGTGAVQGRLASRTSAGAAGGGASAAPTLTAKGDWVFFQTAAADVATDVTTGPDLNGVADIALCRQVSPACLLLARTGATSPAANPMTSPHGNYLVFERGGQALLNYIGAK